MLTTTTTARQRAAAAQQDIREAVLRVLAAHGIEYAQVSGLSDLGAGELALNLMVYDRDEIRPKYLDVIRVKNQIASIEVLKGN